MKRYELNSRATEQKVLAAQKPDQVVIHDFCIEGMTGMIGMHIEGFPVPNNSIALLLPYHITAHRVKTPREIAIEKELAFRNIIPMRR